ncbi:MAG: cellulase family glycosylhydrolase [Spirochaetaceae bacterium]|nr:cellulase family glycosylhydrolase [Spirochaetaceae bacterium]
MKKLIALVLLLAATTCLFAAKEKKPPKVEKTMPFKKGLNLSNWIELYRNENPNVLSDFFGKQDFEDIKSLGVEIIRLPVHFEEASSGAPDYIVEDWIWEKIDNAVEWCTELEMYLIIDFHNDCAGESKTRPDIDKVLLKIWPQIAERYKDSGKYVLYEIYNEPHMKSGNIAADVSKWNKIQGNVLKKIREIDKTHTVIVGAEGWNSVVELLKLPDYKDDNLIYNFHDYEPFLFTTQGAEYDTRLVRLKHIPFPYSKEKMPPLPQNPTKEEIEMYEYYPHASKEETIVKPLDEAVKFANKRNVALMCNEYGVSMDYADPNERTNWYRLMTKWMDERNIIHISWNYRESFGIFNNSSLYPNEARFPEDLNIEILKAMGFNEPQEKNRPHISWFENARKTSDYTIYKNGFAKNVYTKSESTLGCRINKKDSADGERYIYIPRANSYGNVYCLFGEECDFSSLVSSGKSLEFEIRSNQKNLNCKVYFQDSEIKDGGKNGLPWKFASQINDSIVPPDGKWHKVRIPLSKFAEYGAYSQIEQKWYNPEGLFTWKRVDTLVFDTLENGLQADLSIRNIVIR